MLFGEQETRTQGPCAGWVSKVSAIGGVRDRRMSAFGTKRTWAGALQMSAFGGKADIAS
jgi:hypothetical protein